MEINHDKKLGRGLSALLGESSNSKNINKLTTISKGDDDSSVNFVSVNNIIAGVYQPRKLFDQNQLLELSNSIRENGIIQPIIVRKADEHGTFEIIAGERRFRAAKMVDLDKVPVIIKNIDNIHALEFAIIENIQRTDLSVIEEAYAYKQLMNEFEYSQEQTAKKIGRSRSHIANILRLLSLPSEVQELLGTGKISFGHAKAIINHENIVDVARSIIKNNWTVRELESYLKDNPSKIISKNTKAKNSNLSQKKKKQGNERINDIKFKLNNLLPGTIIDSEYNQQKKEGKITILFKNLEKFETLINDLL